MSEEKGGGLGRGSGGEVSVLWVRHCQACHNLEPAALARKHANPLRRKVMTTPLCTLDGATEAVFFGTRIAEMTKQEPSRWKKIEIFGSYLPRELETGKLLRSGLVDGLQGAGVGVEVVEEIRPLCFVSERLNSPDRIVQGWNRIKGFVRAKARMTEDEFSKNTTSPYHSRTVRSAEPDASVSPEGEKHTLVTYPACPRKVVQEHSRSSLDSTVVAAIDHSFIVWS